jgi:hypothetical protein
MVMYAQRREGVGTITPGESFDADQKFGTKFGTTTKFGTAQSRSAL